MTMDPRRFASLMQLAEVKKSQSLARLASAKTHSQKVLADLASLDAATAKAAEATPNIGEGGALAAQEQFFQLMRQQRAELNLELARCRARWMECQMGAARSFGQNLALKKISKVPKPR